ncbi:uncharacterized protein PpBr36_09765 [Pyricularia pennisetigena]|uniref:uncharacterized protein n=1 Tax=Pyricularia pennisetigena TaxID=1578925 RepID=UPI00114EDE71|nr:uncharacterized protein PpBr36_09765 [Pyricularia pennisetigena]TLS22457.1 hypothetical protein PpBr36_09765 [Pyricularia pennisetigena]
MRRSAPSSPGMERMACRRPSGDQAARRLFTEVAGLRFVGRSAHVTGQLVAILGGFVSFDLSIVFGSRFEILYRINYFFFQQCQM